MDGVGKWGVNYDYYLKYRPEGAAHSSTLGCANLKKDDDYMWFNVSHQHHHEGVHPDTGWGQPKEGDLRNQRWTDDVVTAHWIISRRVKMFGPPDPEYAQSTVAAELQTNLVGNMQIGGWGNYHRHAHHEYWQRYESYTEQEPDGTDKDGRTVYVTVTKYHWKDHSSRSDKHKTDVKDWT